MVARVPDEYRFDPADPRAPTHEQWERMSPEERKRVVAMLPSKPPAHLTRPSEVSLEDLGIELAVYCDNERIVKLWNELDEALSSKEDAERRAENADERAQTEAERAQTEAERAQTEAERAAKLEQEVAALKAELERLRRGEKPSQ